MSFIIVFILILLSGLRIAQEYQRGVVFRLGRFTGLRGPGLYWIIPLGIERARTIDIQSFVAGESIDWIWYDTPYYVTPDDPIGEEAYCVIRDAMRSTAMSS